MVLSGIWILGIALFIVIISIRQINQYERGVRFLLGKYRGIMDPGWRLVFPIIHRFERMDLRVVVVDVPDQDAITKDNVSVAVNAVLYFKVIEPKNAILEVEDFRFAVSQLAQTTMRDVIGEVTLDELLAKRDDISKRIREIVDKATDPWGISVVSVELKHIELPKDMQRVLARSAEAERERRGVIVKAASMLSKAEGALHLRTLQTISEISSDQSSKIIIGIPLEILRAFEGKKR